MSDSDFGQGLTYCLGLFLCHAERWPKKSGVANCLGADRPGLWFNAASDHLYDLQIPESLPEPLRTRLANLQDKALRWGHGFQQPEPTEQDAEWAIQEAKDLLREIDSHFGIEVVKGTWE